MQKIPIFSFCNFYILLWLVYSLQSMVFGASGTIYSQVIFFFQLLVSIYYTGYALHYYKMPSYMKALTVFVLVLTIYGFILLASPVSYSAVPNYVYLQGLFISLLPIYPFYIFTRQGKLTRASLRWWTLLFFVAVTLQYFLQRQNMLMKLAQIGSQREEITNNTGYDFLSVIPLLAFFSKKKIVQYAGLVYVMIFILMCMKRGAILIGTVCVVWFLYLSLKNAKRGNKIAIIFLSVVAILISCFALNNLLENSDYFNQRIEQTLAGDSSGRDEIYETLLAHFLNESNPLMFMFGNGANGTLKITGHNAHNDWLELAINQGLLGIVIYFTYWFCFYKSMKRKRYDEELFMATSLLFVSNLLRSFFSMSYGDMSIYATVCLGYCMGAHYLPRKSVNKSPKVH